MHHNQATKPSLKKVDPNFLPPSATAASNPNYADHNDPDEFSDELAGVAMQRQNSDEEENANTAAAGIRRFQTSPTRSEFHAVNIDLSTSSQAIAPQQQQQQQQQRQQQRQEPQQEEILSIVQIKHIVEQNYKKVPTVSDTTMIVDAAIERFGAGNIVGAMFTISAICNIAIASMSNDSTTSGAAAGLAFTSGVTAVSGFMYDNGARCWNKLKPYCSRDAAAVDNEESIAASKNLVSASNSTAPTPSDDQVAGVQQQEMQIITSGMAFPPGRRSPIL